MHEQATVVSVIVKNEEKRLTKKFPIYDTYSVHEDDPIIKECIESTVKEFGDDPEDISVKITMVVQ